VSLGKITYGADEAGRGPILGPMVIAVVGLDRGASISLSKQGVADSKRFGAGNAARQKRAELAAVIRERAPWVSVRCIEVDEIDHYTYRGQLNVLERKVVLELLEELGAAEDARIFCDGANMFAPLRRHYPQLKAVNDGESAHVSVAAASILAKHERDRRFEEIATRYADEFGPVTGGGYLNAATRRFLDAYRERHGDLPPEARRSWGAEKVEAQNLDLFERA
jgi:ribonuclease HII